jgi:hypothetical protein
MGYFCKTFVATRILVLLGMVVATPVAAATFDGAWNVQIDAANAAYGGGATISIGIANGQVESSNALMKATGRVADAGGISVTLTSGIKRAVGSGHLSATSGSGTWRGALCSGTWTAQRI